MMEEQNMIIWCYSINDEYFKGTYPSKQSALEEAVRYANELNLSDDTRIRVGISNDYVPTVDEEHMIEKVIEDADSEMDSDLVDGWLDNTTNESLNILCQRLSKVFNDWLKEFGYEPNFFTVSDIEEYTLGELNEQI